MRDADADPPTGVISGEFHVRVLEHDAKPRARPVTVPPISLPRTTTPEIDPAVLVSLLGNCRPSAEITATAVPLAIGSDGE